MKNKYFIFIVLSLILSFGIVLAAEYTVEEGGECSQDSDCALQVCKVASCDVNGQCVHTDEPDGTSCDDGLICTENDNCQIGSCSGQAVDTDDSVDCTVDSCDETNGAVHTPDNNLCGVGETCDFSQGCLVSGGNGGGGGAVDTTAPSITDIEESIASNSISISWKTNESSISWVIYGLTDSYGQEVKTSIYKTSHSVMLSNLSSETLYHYKVKSKDNRVNVGFSDARTFTTLKGGEEPVEVPVGQMTIEQLKARIAEIIALIAQLQFQLAQLQGGTGIPVDFKFENPLYFGQNSEEVKYLQIFLNSDSDTRLAVQPGAWGSSGKESIYFGNATKAAVIKFQEKYTSDVLAPWGFTKGTGIVGPTTRAKINGLLGRE